jgi:S-(hydroxymethyl)glutathione dehydrogenase/alcohol dehydrogenase
VVRAALLTEVGRPLTVVDLRQPVPAVLGHESAGTVVSVGDGVTSCAPGDRVVLCWAPPCGACWFCAEGEPWLCERSSDAAAAPYASVGGEPVYPGLSTAGFAEETVVSERAVVAVPDAVPLEHAALVGCAVMTGVGAVTSTARVRAGQSVLVVGLGGVGLSVVQGARLVGASTVIAVDRSPEKLQLALSMGATEALEASDDLAKQVRGLTGGRGADAAFDCVGSAATIRASWSATRRGGTTVVVGIGGKEQQVSFSALELFHFARTLTGCVYGSTDPLRDIPVLLDHAAAGRLDLGALVTSTVGLDGIEDAFAAMAAGTGARTVVLPTA